jgi:hypothetical protein
VKLERYRFIENQTGDYPLRVLCRAMKVSLPAFYAYLRGASYRQTKRQAELDNRVRECFSFTAGATVHAGSRLS